MFQLSVNSSLKYGIAAVVTALALLPQKTLAQTPAAGQAPPALTTILIAEHRTSSEAAHKDIINSMMKETLNNVYRESGLYTVDMFSPSMSVLKQALLTHALDNADLDEPLKETSVHKIAKFFGARTILTFHSVEDKLGIKTDVAYEELAAQDAWQTKQTNQYHTPNVIGRRKLKLEEMVAVNVDAIAKSLNVPSHLLAELHLEIAGKQTPAPGASTSKQADPGANADATSVAENPTTQVQSPGPAITQPTAQSTKAQKKNNDSFAQQLFNLGNIPDETPATIVEGQPLPTSLAHAGVVENITNEDRALRYRRSGDMASTILYLRHAVDDKPNDLNVRQELIKAYQDDNEPEMAEAEIGRSLRLDSKNSGLYRMYGDAQYASGNSAEAMKAYKQAVDLDPKDTLARVALADMLNRDGQFDAAMQQYHDAAASAPTSPLPHRRLARALCQRAASDPDQYTTALAEIKKARALTAPIDTQTYLDDYVAMMRIVESRTLDLLQQLDGAYGAFVRAQANVTTTNRVLKDMTERAQAASDFLDALPVAEGQEGIHALYQEGLASTLSAMTYLKSLVATNSSQFETKLKTEEMSARHDLAAAAKKLQLAKPAADAH